MDSADSNVFLHSSTNGSGLLKRLGRNVGLLVANDSGDPVDLFSPRDEGGCVGNTGDMVDAAVGLIESRLEGDAVGSTNGLVDLVLIDGVDDTAF